VESTSFTDAGVGGCDRRVASKHNQRSRARREASPKKRPAMFRIPTSSDVPNTGYWGAATAVHQFCEPKYATSHFFAEFFNSVSSLVYVFAALHILTQPEVRQDMILFAMGLSVVTIGLGSAAFHGTMLFEYELCDEVPMLIFISMALVSKCGCHPWLLTRGRCQVYSAAVVVACTTTVFVYAKLAVYELFVASFTLLVVADVALAYTCCSTQRVTRWALNLSTGSLIVAKAVWEVEVRLCASDRRVWPLHIIWHLLSCASAYYGILAETASRIDCRAGVTFGGGDGKVYAAGSIVPLNWMGVPFAEVTVTRGRADKRAGRSKAS
jgi:dihydroceramidase